MRIALNAGGLGGMPVSSFQSDAASLTSKIDILIVTFVAVKNQTCNLNGGVGALQGALDSVQARINNEVATRDAAIAAQVQVNSFLALTIQIDNQVAAMLLQNKEEFYSVNPWLRPASDKPWYENAWNAYWGFWADAGEFLKNAWDGLMEWCNSNIGRIVLGIIAVVGAVLLVVLIISTGGLALAPLLMAWGLSAGLAAGISMTVAGIALVSTAIAFIPNTFDLIAAVDETINPENPRFAQWNNSLHQMEWYNTVQNVANITSAISGGMYSIGNIYNGIKGITNESLKEFGKIVRGGNAFDFHLDPNSSFFWSGLGKDGQDIAANIANKMGGVTLETTMDAQGINMPVWNASDPSSIAAWRSASASYAWSSSGQTTALLGENIRMSSVWRTLEYPLLKMNPSVTSMIAYTANGLKIIPSYITMSAILSGIFSGIGNISHGLLSGQKH